MDVPNRGVALDLARRFAMMASENAISRLKRE
jgi:hypothetical protein